MASGSAGATPARPALTIERTYDAAPEQVWQAWTDPRALMKWMGPEETETVRLAEVDLRVGGRYRIAFVTRDGEEHDVSGEYREIDPQRRLVFTWAWRSTPERESLVTVELRPLGAGTRLGFRHERFFDQAARDNHERGWLGTFVRLADYLRRSQGLG